VSVVATLLDSTLVLGLGEGIEAVQAVLVTHAPLIMDPLFDQLPGVQLSVPVGVPVTETEHEPICGWFRSWLVENVQPPQE
jgi:hypothetical protein